jgi:hypothetical protein
MHLKYLSILHESPWDYLLCDIFPKKSPSSVLQEDEIYTSKKCRNRSDFRKNKYSQVLVAHAYNPSYSEG